jgi:hypothetical protein
MSEDLPGLLSTDVKRQQEIAQEALNEAKKLDDFLSQQVPDPATLRQQLAEAKESFLQLARKLAINANTTSNTAITVISSVVKAK